MSLNRIAASKPKRCTGCNVTSAARAGVVQSLMKSPGAGPQRPVFREIAARLTHQPDRRRPDRFAAQGPQQRFRHRHSIAGRPFALQFNTQLRIFGEAIGPVDTEVPAFARVVPRTVQQAEAVYNAGIPVGLPDPSTLRRGTGRASSRVRIVALSIPVFRATADGSPWRARLSPVSSHPWPCTGSTSIWCRTRPGKH